MANNDLLELLELRLRNFLSYGNNYTTFDLTVPGTTLIVGEDLDSGTSSANGVGKSSILNGIVYALYDMPLAKEIKLDKLINNINKKNMEVHIKFRKGFDEYEISRYRKGKDGNTVILKKNGTPVTRDSIDQTNKYIEQVIGYSYDLFVRIVVFSAGHVSFLDLPTSGAKKPTQSDIMEELFDLMSLSDKAENAKKEIKANEQRMDVIKAKIEQIERERDRHAQQVENTKNLITEWVDNQVAKITRMQNELAKLEGINFEREQELHKQLGELLPRRKELKAAIERAVNWEDAHELKTIRVMKDLKKLQGIDFDAQIDLHQKLGIAIQRQKDLSTAYTQYNDFEESHAVKLSRLAKEIDKLRDIDFDREKNLHIQLADKQNTLKNLNSELEQIVRVKGDSLVTYEKLSTESKHLFDATCPYCLQNFAGAKEKGEKIGVQLDDIGGSLKKYDVKIKQTNDEISTLAAQIVEIKDSLTIKTMVELTKLQADKDSFQQRYDEAYLESNPYKDALCSLMQFDTVNESLIRSDLADLAGGIEKCKEGITVDSVTELFHMKADFASLNERFEELTNEVNPNLKPLEDLVGRPIGSETIEEDTATALADISKQIQNLQAQISVDNIEELLEIKSNSATMEKRIGEMQVEANPYETTLQSLLSVDLDEAEYDAVNEMTKLVEHQRFLVKLLTKSDSFVRKNLIEQNIPFLNARLRENVKDLGLQHKVQFTNTMEVQISLMGRELDVANLSRGQKARVNIALAWAFHDVLQSMHGAVNFCLLDEVLDVGLCSVGVIMAAKMLKNRAKRDKLAMFIISHKQEVDSIFDRTMKIQLHRGFSKVAE